MSGLKTASIEVSAETFSRNIEHAENVMKETERRKAELYKKYTDALLEQDANADSEINLYYRKLRGLSLQRVKTDPAIQEYLSVEANAVLLREKLGNKAGEYIPIPDIDPLSVPEKKLRKITENLQKRIEKVKGALMSEKDRKALLSTIIKCAEEADPAVSVFGHSEYCFGTKLYLNYSEGTFITITVTDENAVEMSVAGSDCAQSEETVLNNMKKFAHSFVPAFEKKLKEKGIRLKIEKSIEPSSQIVQFLDAADVQKRGDASEYCHKKKIYNFMAGGEQLLERKR